MKSRDTQRRVDAYLDFRAGLREVLREGNPETFRLFLRDSSEDLHDPDLRAMARWPAEALLPVMHRMIMADKQLAEKHAASRTWLRERNLSAGIGPTGYGWSQELRSRYRVVEEQGHRR
jgi:hypothetical protein